VRLRVAPLVLALLLAAGCGNAQRQGPDVTPSPALTSGVTGRTMVDGGCPVIMESSPCPDRPLAARATVADADNGSVAATATTGDDGSFRIPLPAGRYVIHATNLTGGPLPAAAPVDIDVPPGQFIALTVAFDSGIR